MLNPDIQLMRRILERLLLTIYMEAKGMRQKRLLNFMNSRMPCIMLILWLIVRAWIVSAETQTIEHSTIKDYNFTQETTKEESQWAGHISYIFGYKRLNNDWEGAQDHVEFGLVDLDFQKKNWPIHIAGQFLSTYSPDTPDEAAFKGDFSGTYELNLGLRKVWERPSQFHPYFGGGVSIIGASITDDLGDGCYYQEDHDSSYGFWVGTGFYWILSEKWHTGLNFQYSYAEVELFGEELNAGGLHFNLLIGWHW